jgi:4-hydroxy-tetrahydrodipicolinate reductase
MINVLLNGSNGKMGGAFENYIKNSKKYFLKYKIDKENSDSFNSILIKPDVIVDFSNPKATFNSLNYAVENLVPVVIATTGFSQEEDFKIQEFSEAIPIFKSSNLSYGIHILTLLSNLVIEKFGNKVDIEIIEKHHRNKKDAPSGTALMIADSINYHSNNKYKYVFDKSIKANSKDYNEIGFSSIRGGNIAGEHSIMFFGSDETIEISHKAYSRNIYIEGALKATDFIINQKNGLFNMNDLF